MQEKRPKEFVFHYVSITFFAVYVLEELYGGKHLKYNFFFHYYYIFTFKRFTFNVQNEFNWMLLLLLNIIRYDNRETFFCIICWTDKQPVFYTKMYIYISSKYWKHFYNEVDEGNGAWVSQKFDVAFKICRKPTESLLFEFDRWIEGAFLQFALWDYRFWYDDECARATAVKNQRQVEREEDTIRVRLCRYAQVREEAISPKRRGLQDKTLLDLERMCSTHDTRK